MSTSFSIFAGIDWSYQSHQICALSPEGARLDEFSVTHSGPELARLADRLIELAAGDPARVAVVIEVPRGPVVETLVDRSIAVFVIAPKQLDRFRDRHTSAGAKDDRLDAFVAADAARTDLEKLRPVRLASATRVHLRELSRLEVSLATDLSRLTNRVRDQLIRYFPALLALCPAADEAWFWEVLERVPTPSQAAQASKTTVAAILKRHRKRAVSADDVLKAIGEEPLVVGAGVAEAAAEHILLLLPLLRTTRAQLKQVERRVGELVAGEAAPEPEKPGQHRDAAILASLPGVGRVVAATMLAEAPEAIAARDVERLRTETGVAPVTKRSGKRMVHVMRYACNGRLRRAMYYWALNAMVSDEHWKARYAAMRARGHGHGRALRSLADALLRVLVAMLRDGTLYDAKHERRAQRTPSPIQTGGDTAPHIAA